MQRGPASFLAASLAVLALVATLLVTRATTDTEYETTTTILESSAHGPELCLGGVLTSLPPQCGGMPITNWDWDAVDDEESLHGTTWVDAYVRGTSDGKIFSLTRPPGRPRRSREDTSRFDPACARPDAVDTSDGGAAWEEASQRDGGTFSDIPGLIAIWVTDRPRDDPPVFVANLVVRPGRAADVRTRVRRHYRGALCIVERDQRTIDQLEADFARIDDILTATFLTADIDERTGVIRVELAIVDERSQREVDEAFGKGVVVLTGQLEPVSD
jgi:hypothetical protein